MPLLDVVIPDYGRGPAAVTRVDRFRTISIKGDVDLVGGYNANEIVSKYTDEVLDKISKNFPGVRIPSRGNKASSATVFVRWESGLSGLSC